MSGGLGGVGLGIGLLSSAMQLINGSNSNNQSQQALDTLAANETNLIKKQNQELAAEQAQPAELAQRQLQENLQQQLQTKNSPFSNPLAVSSSGGLRGTLG